MTSDASELSASTAAALAAAHLDTDAVIDLIQRAIAEDLAGGVDVTSVATVPSDQRSILDLVARADGVVAGAPVAAAVFEIASSGRVAASFTADGSSVKRGDVLVSAVGPTRDLLLAERTALNLLCHLSGVATLTHTWVNALGPSGTRVRDTRKTTPGMRALEKYAVRCGGGVNHRMSLSDAALVKDNHVVAAGGVAAAFDAVRRQFPGIPVEVEVDSLEQLDDVVAAGADLVLLDNFTPDRMAEAVRRVAGRAQLEASGGLTLEMAPAVAATGVDFVAVGALTHSAPVLDIGADLRETT
ncbi:MAG: nicotinate-nucleotide diphosphorylase (carboxylating) [Actinomycetales bacterium mxb001]|nr:MAG: nicotinate-nucleotide diphosphorylase (carboxylating) [Actinomycetales bacterium mxb001]